jgi:hypothetical protein
MALPPRRAANRRAAMGRSRDEYDEPGGRMTDHRSHNSPASRGAQKGPGPRDGNEMPPTPHAGPGRAARSYLGIDESMFPTRPTPPGSAPREMDVYPAGSPSNKSRT